MNAYMSELKSYYKKVISSETIFCSRKFLAYLQNLAQLISRRYGRAVSVEIKYDINNNDLAYTDNHVVVINAGHSELSGQSDDARYYAIIGLLAHELGHLLYTDFAFMKQINDGILASDLTCIETHLSRINPEIKAAAQTHPTTFIRMLHDVMNIMEDRYVEHEVVKRYAGSFKKGLETVSQILAPKDVIGDDIRNLMWYQCLYELSQEVYEKEPAFKAALCIVEQIDEAHNFGLRVGLVFSYIDCLWEYLRDQFDEAEQPQDSKKDGNGEPTSSSQSESGGTPLDSSQQANSLDSMESTDINADDKKLPSMAFTAFLDELIAENLQDDNVKEQIAILIESEMLNKINQAPHHYNVDSVTINIHPKSTDMEFNDKLTECRAISKRLQKRVVESVLERERGTRVNGLSLGRRIDGRAAARGDSKIFTKSTYPDKKPLLSVAVVLDESGSMSGERIRQTQKAALVLEDFCRNLNVPLLLIGHTETSKVEIRKYVGFNDQRKRSDANKLAQVKSRSSNRDGFALRYVVNQIAKRKERHRVVIMISDGKPCAKGYGFANGKADIQDCISTAKRRGITVIGIAIGDDLAQLSEIYGKGLVDARNMSTLPNTLTNILVKMLK